ncbi:MAG: hypothetical protein JWQ34_323 [Mucilaginibacter sp.]|uniref:hypothetical protein n=1 Tax=Mucilaginibacter sp. TaxID=1882438 RepID=UPI00261EB891|nr:hypothetical protein [Mucilaginibacter sp.]MDB5002098.1 hypothetical protein [Mucilaginibacter sp.]
MTKNVGLDYGLKPIMALISNIEFPDLFKKANCTGLIYGFCPNTSGEEIPHELSFMMENENYAEQFLDVLIQWKDSSGGDSNAVELEFVELKNGDYTLVISPDNHLLMKRLVPEHLDDRINPRLITMSQGKGGMRIGKNYLTFRDKYIKDRRIVVRYTLFKDGQYIKQSSKYFVKTEFQFYTEDNVPNDSNAVLAIGNKPGFKLPKPPKIEINNENLLTRRHSELKYFFPITHDKIVNEKWLENIITTINKNYTSDQIIQAICNLVLFERLQRQKPMVIDLKSPGYDLSILEYLIANFESFDSYFPEDNFFTKQKIENQIRLDAKFLKERINI